MLAVLHRPALVRAKWLACPTHRAGVRGYRQRRVSLAFDRRKLDHPDGDRRISSLSRGDYARAFQSVAPTAGYQYEASRACTSSRRLGPFDDVARIPVATRGDRLAASGLLAPPQCVAYPPFRSTTRRSAAATVCPEVARLAYLPGSMAAKIQQLTADSVLGVTDRDERAYVAVWSRCTSLSSSDHRCPSSKLAVRHNARACGLGFPGKTVRESPRAATGVDPRCSTTARSRDFRESRALDRVRARVATSTVPRHCRQSRSHLRASITRTSRVSHSAHPACARSL